jgi:hypothetical protein
VGVLTRSLVAALLFAAAALAGCFSARQPPCAFSCAADGVCPAGYSCGSDGVCHHDNDPGSCDIPAQIDAGDAAADATAMDGASTAAQPL